MHSDDSVPIENNTGDIIPEWKIVPDREGLWRVYYIMRWGEVVADAKWIKRGAYAEIHNEVYSPSVEVIKQCKRLFKIVQIECKRAGCAAMTTTQRGYDPKFMRYLKLMGFTNFGATKEI
jgi:hypothetical protein